LFLRIVNSRHGGLAKVVRRRLQVLHLSHDGATALLGIDVREEDTRCLELNDHQEMILRKGDQVFQLQMQPGSQATRAATAPSVPLSGTPFTNFENIVQVMARHAPRLYMVMGPDEDGVLRHMGLSRIWTGSADYPMLPSTELHVPLYNIRIGDFKESENTNRASGDSTDIAWMGWFLPGDDDNSKRHPFEGDDSNCCSYLVCFFKHWLACPALTIPCIHKLSREMPMFFPPVTKLLLSLT